MNLRIATLAAHRFYDYDDSIYSRAPHAAFARAHSVECLGNSRPRYPAILFLTVVMLVGRGASGQPYPITDLGTLDGTNSYPNTVSNGQVVGWSDVTGDAAYHPFAWTQLDGMVDLGTLGGTRGSAYAVSNGQVVGYTYTSGDSVYRAFSWTQAEGMIDLGTLVNGSSSAVAVSNGVVVGNAGAGIANDPSPVCPCLMTHAFIWTQAGGMVDLGTLGGTNSTAQAVDNGQVVGSADLSGNTDTGSGNAHAFSWTQAGGMVDLGTLGGAYSIAVAVSNGQVVGMSYTSSGSAFYAFSWTQAGGMVDLGTLGGTAAGYASFAAAVSNGQVVGGAATSSGARHAFSWTQAGGMVDLGTLGGATSEATAVSNGQVVGFSATNDGATHAFSWTPADGMIDLGTLGGANSAAQAFDGQIIAGQAEDASGSTHAVIWRVGSEQASSTPTVTATGSSTRTPTVTPSETPTTSPTVHPTHTSTETATVTPTPTDTPTPPTPTPTPTGCLPAPRTCRPAEKSILWVRDKIFDGNDRLSWKWIKGTQTSQTEFGNPTTTADYALCVYAGTASALVGQSVIPASAAKWHALSTKGYKYNDPTATEDGITKVLLKGSDQNKSEALVKGKGAGLPALPLPVTAPVTVQLVNGQSGLCWGANYTGAQLLKNDTGHLKAHGP